MYAAHVQSYASEPLPRRHPQCRARAIVFRRRTGVPICFTGLPRICVRQAVRHKHVVGPYGAISRDFWLCAGVYRVAGVASFQEI